MTDASTIASQATKNNILSDADNAAWASINTPLSTDDLLTFCTEDIQRLFRINPYLEFEHWENLGNNHYTFSGLNYSQEQPFHFEVELKVEDSSDGLRIHYLSGLKNSTDFKIEASPHGSKLTLHESYHPVEQQQEEELTEVDRSLTTWAGDIQKYLIMWNQWQWVKPWRWYMRKIWQPMKPSARRITYMFWWITLVEIALICLGVAIYWAEYF